MKIWEPKPSGTLRATPGLLRDSFTLSPAGWTSWCHRLQSLSR